jgi:eukaryotic-like serine/threonine-protein kinase
MALARRGDVKRHRTITTDGSASSIGLASSEGPGIVPRAVPVLPEPDDVTRTAASSREPPERAAAPAAAAVTSPRSPAPLQYRDPERYELIAEHGRCGLGRVSRARDRELGREVAVKELLRRSYGNEARFFREALITARLEHPGIVPVHEAGRWPDGTPFYSMKLVAGRPLKELIAEAADLPARLALVPNVIAVAEAIAYAHDRRIIHRDLKPANVIVGEFGETVVIDWGLAKDLTDTSPDPLDDGPFRTAPGDGLTAAGSVLGTPAYMAPEQRAGQADERSDIYALGGILYHVVTGASPNPDGGTGARSYPADAPRDLVAIAERALAAEPARRYPSAAAFAADLGRFSRREPVAARRYSLVARAALGFARHRTVGLVLIAGLVALAAVLAVAIVQVSRQRAREAAARRDAEAALAQADADKNRLILTNARAALDRDPTAALAWLKRYSGSDRDSMVGIAADAASRGFASLLLAGHVGGVASLAVATAGDGRRRIYSTSIDRKLLEWDISTGEQAVVHSAVMAYGAMALSPSKDVLVFADDAGGLMAWSPQTRTIARLGDHDGAVEHVAFIDDALLLVQAPTRPFLAVLGPEMPKTGRRELPGADGPVGTTVVGPRGLVATCTRDGRFFLWRVSERKIESVAADSCAGGWSPLAFAPSVEMVAIATAAGISILEVGAASPRSIVAEAGEIISLSLSPLGKTLAYGDARGRVRVLDTRTLQVLAAWEHRKGDTRVYHSPDGSRVISAASDGVVSVHDLKADRYAELRGHQATIFDVACLDAGCAALATASSDWTIRVWRIPADRQTRVSAPGDWAYNAIFVGGADRIAGTSRDGRVQLWRRAGTSWRLEGSLKHPSPALELAASRTTAAFAAGDLAGGISIWDEGVEPRHLDGHRGPVNALAFSADGRSLFTGGGDGAVLAWDVAAASKQVLHLDRKAVSRLALVESDEVLVGFEDGAVVLLRGARAIELASDHGLVTGIVYSGARLAVSVGSDGTIRRLPLDGAPPSIEKVGTPGGAVAICGHRSISAWKGALIRIDDLRTGATTSIRLPGTHVREIACSADQQMAAFACKDGTVRLLRLADGAQRIIRAHHDIAGSVAFSPAGGELLSAGFDGVVRIWSLDEPLIGTENIHRWLESATQATTAQLMEEDR